MKAALPVKMGRVDKYFERAKTFLILEIEATTIKKKYFFSVNPRQSNHGQLIYPFQNSGVKLIIVDKIGAKVNQTLKENGFKVITGARGPVTEVVQRIIHGRCSLRSLFCIAFISPLRYRKHPNQSKYSGRV